MELKRGDVRIKRRFRYEYLIMEILSYSLQQNCGKKTFAFFASNFNIQQKIVNVASL